MFGSSLLLAVLLVTSLPQQQPTYGASEDSPIHERLHGAEYEFSLVTGEENVWSAPNRSQGLRCRLSASGLEVFPRETDSGGNGAVWKLAIRTISFGRKGDLRELRQASLRAANARMELHHGPLTEWFENQNEGIEQGWAIPERPHGVDLLWIGLAVQGDLSLRIDDRGRSGVFVEASGEARLRYLNLRAWDATGRDLYAQLRPSPGGVGIAIDDRGAVYPLHVDPLFTAPAWIAEGDQAEAYFGASVATAGDVNGDGYSDVIVGAPGYDNSGADQGRVFAYLGSAEGFSTSPPWFAEGNQIGAGFGGHVASAGDVNGDGYSDMIVGAHDYRSGEFAVGRAWVYLGSPMGLLSIPSWTVEGDQEDLRFGNSVASAGDVNGDGYSDVIVGAPYFDNEFRNQGRAYVYLGSAAGLDTSPAWTADGSQPDDQLGAQFGWSVAGAGDVNGDGYGDVIVGADQYENNRGGAFLYLGSAAGLTFAWSAVGDHEGASLGGWVASAGDVNGDGFSDVLVDAYGYYIGQDIEGRLYLYLGSAAGLSPSPAWTADGEQNGANIGYGVSSAGDVNGDGFGDVLFGTWHPAGDSGRGRVYVYLGSAAGLSATAAWLAEVDQDNAGVSSVGTAGDINGDGYGDVICGVPTYDNNLLDQGRVYVHLGSAGELAAEPTWSSDSDLAGASSFSVASAGDVNGDGYSDVIIGAYDYHPAEFEVGRAWVYLGSPIGLLSSPSWTVEGNQEDLRFGNSVASAGDVNGDGYSDVIVGAPYFDNQFQNQGRAYVYLGSGTGLGTSPAWTADGSQPDDQLGAQFGWSVAGAGDVNGDGYGDVIVGADQYGNDRGGAFLYLGSAAGASATHSWSAVGDHEGANLGGWVASAGDVNGDGFGDVLVDAYGYYVGEERVGRLYLFLGSPDGLSSSANWTVQGGQGEGSVGYQAGSAGDINGDGYGDILFGASYDNGVGGRARAYLYLGSTSGLSTTANWFYENDQDNSGLSIAAAGDINGDGYSDVIVGAPGYDNNLLDQGRVYAHLGSAGGLATSASWSIDGDQEEAYCGHAVASGGDVNGDGYGDVIIGGRDGVSVYQGNDGGAPTVNPCQQRVSGGPIAVLGRSDRQDSFFMSVEFGRDLAGYSWAKPGTTLARLQWEIVPHGGTFDGIPDGESAPQIVIGSKLVFDESVGGLVPGNPYTWRARIATDNPLFPNTPWFTIQGRPLTETKLRTKEAKVRLSGPPLSH